MMVRFFEIEPREGGPTCARWLRTFGIDEAGAVYCPAEIAGPEQALFLAAAYDGARAALHGGHVYLPVEWVEAEQPAAAEACAAVRRAAARAQAAERAGTMNGAGA